MALTVSVIDYGARDMGCGNDFLTDAMLAALR
jgi:hypothetical protein